MGYFWGGQKWPQPANKKSKTDIYAISDAFDQEKSEKQAQITS